VSESSPTLGEYQGLPCHHWNEELPLISYVLSAVKPSLVVEAGTMYGGFSAFLADTVRLWGGVVLTIDYVIYPGLEDALRERENLYFVRADLNSSFTRVLIERFIGDAKVRNERVCFYSDAQSGRGEFFEFASLADLSGVHDYGTEVTAEKLEAWATQFHRFPYRHDAFKAVQDSRGGYFVSRFWVVPSLQEVKI